MTSCFSKLRITVDSFDMNVIKQLENDKKNKNIKELISFYQSILKMEINEDFIKNTTDEYLRMISVGKISTDSANAKIVTEQIKKNYSLFTNNFKLGVLEAKKLVENEDTPQYEKSLYIYNKEKDYLIKNFDKLFSQLEQVDTNINSRMLFAELELKIKENIYSEIENTETDFAFGKSILEDPVASFVVSSPKKFWKKYKNNTNIYTFDPSVSRKNVKARANKTVAKTWIGNSDIAVKMESPGNFIVKGARVDSDEALKTSFKVLNQGIKYLAYANGIPIPSENGDENSNEIKIPELAENNKLSRSYSSLNSQSENITKAFLKSLIFEIQKMETKDTTAVDRIKKSYEAYKAILPTTKTE